jgi:signal transduction histidine kinase
VGPSPWLAGLAQLGPAAQRHMVLDDPPLGRTLVTMRQVPGYPAIVAVGRSEAGILAGWREKTWSNVLRTFVITSLAALLLVAFLRQLGRHERVTTQLHQSQKLEALGTLAGGIAHDFNNILGAVLGYGELAVEQTTAGTPLRLYVDNIVLAANRARELVARILAFSRPGIASARALVLQDILTDVRNLTSASLPAQVSVDMQVPAAPIIVSGDSAQLHQMFANLLINAYEALNGRGAIVLSARVLEPGEQGALRIESEQPVPTLVVDVADTGPGVSPELADKIFNPFFTTKPQGSGLGLAIVRKIVDAHDGRIDVSSAADTGTRFRVTLPVATASGWFK